jgi:protein-tyrosine kinase
MAANGSTVTSVYDALQRVRQGDSFNRPRPVARSRRRDQAAQPARPPGPFAAELTPLLATVRPLLSDGRGAVVHFIAAAAGEGTSTIAGEFALLAATTGRRETLLIDAVPNGPESARHFGCDTAHGLLDTTCVGFDDADILHQVLGTSLSVACLAGEHAGGAVNSGMLSGLYNRLREQFELVVVDCPPIERNDYAMLLPDEADGIFLVIQAETTRPAAVAHAKAQAEQHAGRFLGAILNRRRNYIPDFVYRLL